QVNQTEEGTKGEKGTGLGLTIIKELVQKHKELIWAESEIGKGSRFIVTMPKITKKDEETI
ncbi:MAG: ATP-binding protein, partial [Bacteroidales bacterium]|nr:ATP-binding protein [Bacteroidales bacterium]